MIFTRENLLTQCQSGSINFRKGPYDVTDAGHAYAISKIDWSGEKLTCTTSDSGYVPIYYTTNSEVSFFSPSLLKTTQSKPQNTLDWPSIIVFLALGHFIEDHTPFSGVKALPLGKRLVDREGCALEIQNHRHVPQQLSIKESDAIIAYDDLLKHVLNTYPYPTPSALSFSGGRDSRHILLALHQLGHKPPELLTSHHYLGRNSAQDVTTAQKIANKLGIPIEIIYPHENRIEAECTKNKLTEYQVLSHSWIVTLGKRVSDFETLFDGLCGDILFPRGGNFRKIKSLLGDCKDFNFLQDTFIKVMYDDNISELKEFINPKLLTVENIDAGRRLLKESILSYANYPNPLQAWWFYNSTTRELGFSPYKLMQASHIFCPLDDPEMVRWALSLPFDISSDQNFQAKALAQIYPEFTSFPFPENSTPEVPVPLIDKKLEHESIDKLLNSCKGEDIFTERALLKISSGNMKLDEIQIFVYLCQLNAIKKY